MSRPVRYMTRPTLVAIAEECRKLRIPDQHDHPVYRTLPKDVRFYVMFAHPLYSMGYMRALVAWTQRGTAWWMDVPLDRWRRLPRVMLEHHVLRM
jgi:hypothetical protein